MMKVERVDSDEIARMMFQSLSKGDKVGVVLTRTDLDAIIDALFRVPDPTDSQKNLFAGMSRFRLEVFGHELAGSDQ
jgi:hypothetical protein